MKRRVIATIIGLGMLTVGATSRPTRDDPASYAAPQAAGKVVIDGSLDDDAWSAVPWTEDFIDIEGTTKPVPPMRTRAKVTWDGANLYVAAELADPRVWATMKDRDASLFREQAFELFIDPDDDQRQYLELQVNPLNTICDLVMSKPYRDKGTPDVSMNLDGLRSAVRVNGTVGPPSGADDVGWTVEVAIPWMSLKPLGRDGAPPRAGERWRVNFARMRRDAPDAASTAPRGAWVWSSQGAFNMHVPERWGWLEFTGAQTPAPSSKPSKS
jgi:hypothetical protein